MRRSLYIALAYMGRNICSFFLFLGFGDPCYTQGFAFYILFFPGISLLFFLVLPEEQERQGQLGLGW